jgi:hypothetical protein
MVGSLTGAVASKKITGVYKGGLKLIIILIVKRNGIYLLDCEIFKSNRNVSWS